MHILTLPFYAVLRETLLHALVCPLLYLMILHRCTSVFRSTWAPSATCACTRKQVRPPLWSSGQRSWLQIQRSGFDFRRYQIFWEVLGLERGPLSLLSTTEELFGRNSSGSSLQRREYSHGDPLRWPCDTIYRQKLALTSPTFGDHSVGIVLSLTNTTVFNLV
jgi:hypothetical protein